MDDYTRIVTPTTQEAAKNNLDSWLNDNNLTFQEIEEFILMDIVRGGGGRTKYGFRISSFVLQNITNKKYEA